MNQQIVNGIYNQVSFRDKQKCKDLMSMMSAPIFVKEIDWIRTICLSEKHDKEYTRINHYLLTSVKESFMDFHIDMNGSSIWYNIIVGKKTLYV